MRYIWLGVTDTATFAAIRELHKAISITEPTLVCALSERDVVLSFNAEPMADMIDLAAVPATMDVLRAWTPPEAMRPQYVKSVWVIKAGGTVNGLFIWPAGWPLAPTTTIDADRMMLAANVYAARRQGIEANVEGNDVIVRSGETRRKFCGMGYCPDGDMVFQAFGVTVRADVGRGVGPSPVHHAQRAGDAGAIARLVDGSPARPTQSLIVSGRIRRHATS